MRFVAQSVAVDCHRMMDIIGGRLVTCPKRDTVSGMGFIHSAECDIMHNSALINIHMIDTATRMSAPRYFFSSSVCVYRDMQPGGPELIEADAVPAHPDNECGWGKRS